MSQTKIEKLFPLAESAGIDYILPYWMARYYGVISSATGSVI